MDEQDNSTIRITLEDKDKILELSKRKDIISVLKRSFLPEIYGEMNVKEGLLCQLFGGQSKTLKSGSKIRGEINVLLCGDPGVSKSQILMLDQKVAPMRAIYTSGKGSSAVGLTAYVTKDNDSGEFVLESGALVLRFPCFLTIFFIFFSISYIFHQKNLKFLTNFINAFTSISFFS